MLALALLAGVAHADEPSPWVGTWLFHEPNHGSYQANEYAFHADGRLELRAMVDTTTIPGVEAPRRLAVLVRGHRACRFGTRWAPTELPNRVSVETLCTDGRTRQALVEIRADRFAERRDDVTPRVVSVGGARGYRFASAFDLTLLQCSPDPNARCWRLEHRDDVQPPPAAP